MFTVSVNGKTVAKFLTENDARVYAGFIPGAIVQDPWGYVSFSNPVRR
jgi:hypothetical protein